MFKSAAVANEALQMELGSLQRELVAAQAAAAAAAEGQARTASADKAAADARAEAQSALAAAAAMEERLQAAEEEMDRVAGALPPAAQAIRLCAMTHQCRMHSLLCRILLICLTSSQSCPGCRLGAREP